jgi:hypothetical protein
MNDNEEELAFYQYFNGYMMRYDITSEGKGDWDANSPNPFTSDAGLVENMYFGRAIPVPGRKIYAISGCLDKANVKEITRQVQRWDLRTMTVKLCEPIILGRTSYAAFYRNRHIYVIGGNVQSHVSTKSTIRFNIVTQRWTELADLNIERANCGSFVTKNSKYVYAFGGFNFPAGSQQKALASVERLNLLKPEAQFKELDLQPSIKMKACFYMY